MLKRIRILHIEDDELDRELLRENFKNEPSFYYTLDQFSDISSAAAKIRDEGMSYDICLIDLGLRETTGIESYHAFKELGYSVPVVILTGLDDEETGQRAISEGAQDYLIKGKFNSCNLVHAIKFAIGRFRIEQELKLREAQYRCIFESVTDALILLNEEGKILSTNPAAGQIFGYHSNEYTGKELYDLLRIESATYLAGLKKKLLSGEIFQEEVRGFSKEKEELILEITSRQLPIDKSRETLVIIHNITKIKRAEEELIKHRDHLEELVTEKTQEIEDKYFEIARDYKLMIEREYRIKELRDEVEGLKKELIKREK